MDTSLFAQAGLSENQGLIYASLLETGPTTVAEIGRKSGLHRAVIYKELPDLIDKGVLTIIPKGKQKHYVPAPPKTLKRLFDKRAEKFLASLEELEQKHANERAKPVVRILEGRKGLINVMEDVLETLGKGDTFYRYSSRRDDQDVRKYMPENYGARRDELKLQQCVITNHKLKTSPYKNRMDCASKEVPYELDPFQYNISQLIYGRKTALVDFNSETAMIIEDKALADFQKRLFLLLFHRL